ncbi:gluconate 2-dehydrogenase subunit 3 family protein [Microbulbifer thermotolerans]|uniref:Gluconate 2-dehydrogenase subunit 3 family protein n=1 Tax=Microbulbifer thermotolerans TaxID=252514 RepID=A0A143HP09_MICTH|nr:gluconate 2-dehydrogenase subunit 3 family protein [Microbulbifer thermotolerans]AMX03428.1 hypothetical protein A3224_13360 [Microbulbifer thermotolerans]MCX2778095.1 gluconate 2-dehydrogenase subunit 3 family protein [Microbulbifer thermotolerans]MCX2783073.1 gluconate 2-dehydrogenase subunit 3 family protein [Microbulbifer thermotolerans]MCX2795394.1 gluconate 2-dehydrogenase subunit 3 family protein [Microbulbifer thermotolerans]MCX2803090.1 gluconate 2-dehydrogenase subunit 3 family pr
MSATELGPDQARRALLRRAALTLGVSAISPAVSAALLRAGTTPPLHQFSVAHRELVAELADMILPDTDTPGARRAGVPQFIETLFSQFTPGHRARFLRGLEEVNARASVEASDGFLRADATARERIVERMDREAFSGGDSSRYSFFREFKELTLIGYYTSEAGASRELRYVSVPGDYRGCVPLAEIGRSWATE